MSTTQLGSQGSSESRSCHRMGHERRASWARAAALCCLLIASGSACRSDLDLIFATEAGDAARDAPRDQGLGDASRDAPSAREPSCFRHSDCSAGQVCGLGREGCNEPTCGLPPTTDGILPLHADCPCPVPDNAETAGGTACASDECDTNLVCVPRRYAFDETSWQTVSAPGICLAACDPCSPNCEPNQICLQLPEGGGFCHDGPLVPESGNCVDRVCAPPFGCLDISHLPWEVLCVRPCAPDGNHAVHAAPSRDCPAGQVCLGRGSTTYGDLLLCADGTISGETGRWSCNSRLGQHCPATDQCITGRGLCSPLDCAAHCPVGADCYVVPQQSDGSSTLCIFDAEIPASGPCAVDRNCATGLSCQDVEAGLTGSAFLRSCQVAP